MKCAYYNENDPGAAAWLRELIRDGLIAPGVVDERSIEDVTPADVMEFTQVHLFAGLGAWSLALRAAGWSDDRSVWTGSCPCQPFSQSGKGAGADDARHLWPAEQWLVQQCRPDVIFGEQVESKLAWTWLDLVCADLEGEGYAVGAICAPAAGFGAPHRRQRLYWVAVANANGRLARNGGVQRGREHGLQPEDRGAVVVAEPMSAGRTQGRAKPGNGQVTGGGEYGLVADSSSERVRLPGQRQVRDASRGMQGTYGQQTESSGRSRGQLNPSLARWLMGLPMSWDICAIRAHASLAHSKKKRKPE